MSDFRGGGLKIVNHEGHEGTRRKTIEGAEKKLVDPARFALASASVDAKSTPAVFLTLRARVCCLVG